MSDAGCWQVGIVPKATCAPLELPRFAPVQSHQLTMKCLSYNVLSMIDDSTFDQWGRRGGDKSFRMDCQMHAKGIHLAGFQEARTDEGVSFTEHYKIFSAGSAVPSSARQYGCELWFHRTRSWVKEADISFQHSNVVVLHQDPRLLMVRVDNPLGCWVFLSGHAPYWGGSETHDRVRTWWKQLAEICSQVPKQARIVAFLDCNATLGANTSEFIGNGGVQKQGPATSHCEAFLYATQLACPSTFSHIHQGPHGTWRHPSGEWKRIEDCVEVELAVPEEFDDKHYVFQQVHGTLEGAAGVFREQSVSVLDARIRVSTVVFVHLYSGYRRDGDLHHHIENHAWNAGVELFCISVDLCLQGEQGDLLSPVKVEWWKDRIRSRSPWHRRGTSLRDMVSSTVAWRRPSSTT